MAERVCPWWLGYVLLNPLRRMRQDPKKILGPYIHNGMTILEVGPGMGFFTLPMAEMAGDTGKVVCVDVQEKMLRRLLKRAKKAWLSNRIESRVCSQESLGIDDLDGKIDLAIAFYVVHEAPDPRRFITQICKSLKPNGKLLISEPKGHVTKELFSQTVNYAIQNGLAETEAPEIKGSLSVLLCKK
jgi:ubiquinone/menaquinone biosynthesis C-methylase UbiE